MNKNVKTLEELMIELESLHNTVYTLRADIGEAINSAQEEQNKPLGKYELSDLMREIIEQVLDRFIDEHVFDRLDGSYNYNLREGAFDIDVTLDLNDIVCDQISSSHQLANDFVDELVRELNSLKQQDEIAEQGDEQHQDC
jgi:hypothetical protein